jgi:hypothetical protein
LQRLPAPLVGDVVDPRLQWALRRSTSPRLASLPRDGLARASRPVVPLRRAVGESSHSYWPYVR